MVDNRNGDCHSWISIFHSPAGLCSAEKHEDAWGPAPSDPPGGDPGKGAEDHRGQQPGTATETNVCPLPFCTSTSLSRLGTVGEHAWNVEIPVAHCNELIVGNVTGRHRHGMKALWPSFSTAYSSMAWTIGSSSPTIWSGAPSLRAAKYCETSGTCW